MIEVGEFVRTSNNGIKRIDTIFENKTVNKYGYEIGSEWDGKLYSYIKTTDILKHSKNILDLIEVGDTLEIYFPIRKITRKIFVDEYFKDSMILDGIIQKRIILKTILTHEQYKQNAYEVEE